MGGGAYIKILATNRLHTGRSELNRRVLDIEKCVGIHASTTRTYVRMHVLHTYTCDT